MAMTVQQLVEDVRSRIGVILPEDAARAAARGDLILDEREPDELEQNGTLRNHRNSPASVPARRRGVRARLLRTELHIPPSASPNMPASSPTSSANREKIRGFQFPVGAFVDGGCMPSLTACSPLMLSA